MFYIAWPGTIWVCGACGRNGKDRTRIGDESCFLNAVLCVDDKPVDVDPMDHHWTAVDAGEGAAK